MSEEQRQMQKQLAHIRSIAPETVIAPEDRFRFGIKDVDSGGVFRLADRDLPGAGNRHLHRNGRILQPDPRLDRARTESRMPGNPVRFTTWNGKKTTRSPRR